MSKKIWKLLCLCIGTSPKFMSMDQKQYMPPDILNNQRMVHKLNDNLNANHNKHPGVIFYLNAHKNICLHLHNRGQCLELFTCNKQYLEPLCIESPQIPINTCLLALKYAL